MIRFMQLYVLQPERGTSAVAIMTEEEFENSETFFKQSILPQIVKDCTFISDLSKTDTDAVPARFSAMEAWLLQAERHRVPKRLSEEWMAELALTKAELEGINAAKLARGSSRIAAVMEDLKAAAAGMVSRQADIVRVSQAGRNPQDGRRFHAVCIH